jgi:hypothetical protein
VHAPCGVIPETAKRLSGIQKAKQNKEVRVPVFAFSETGMTTNCFRARGGRGRFLLRSLGRVPRKSNAADPREAGVWLPLSLSSAVELVSPVEDAGEVET